MLTDSLKAPISGAQIISRLLAPPFFMFLEAEFLYIIGIELKAIRSS